MYIIYFQFFSSFMDPLTYKSLFPIFYFDVSKQSERFDQSIVDVTVRMIFGGTGLLSNVISDRHIIFKSDGTKMNVEAYKYTK